MKFVGVSTGRAGSAYIAQLFNLAGIPTLHERVFNGSRFVDGQPRPWGDRMQAGEWSAQAVPFLDQLDTVVLHQVRHPLKVIGSYMGFGLFHDPAVFGDEGKVVTDHFGIDPSDPVRSAVRFYLDWNLRCDAHADMRWQVEQITADLLVDVGDKIGVPVLRHNAADALRTLPTDVNSRGDAHDVTWGDLHHIPEVGQLQTMASGYGYEVPDA